MLPGADLFTYMLNPEVFSVKDGHVQALTGKSNDCGRSTLISYLFSHATLIGPGLGININEKLVREASEKYVHEKAWRNATWRGEDGSLREW